jgi:hypothetical protein
MQTFFRTAPPARSVIRAAAFAGIILSGLLTGCVTDAQFLQQNSSAALQAVRARGQFELNCQDVQTTVLSQKVVEGIPGYGFRGRGFEAGPWTEYTVGARGCGREAVYMAVCRDPDNCNAYSQTAKVLNAPP